MTTPMASKILAALSLAFGGYIAAMNWYSIFATRRSGRNVSSVPVLGALFLFLGLLGFPQTRPYAWAGILADYGTLVALLAIPVLVRDSWATSGFNLQHRFVSEARGRRDDVRLFKRGIFTIRTDFDPPVPGDAHGAHTISRSRTGTWKPDGDGFCLEGYESDRALRIRKQDDGYVTVESNCPEAEAFQDDRMGDLALKQMK